MPELYDGERIVVNEGTYDWSARHQIGTVVGGLTFDGGYNVHLDDGRQLWFKPEHLDPQPPSDRTEVSDGTNPKDLLGVKKVQMHLVPEAAVIGMATAMTDGAAKYGPFNWREKPVRATVYISAAKRHLAAWFDGENYAEDSGVHHLDHAMACLGILRDAESVGNMVDDRPTPGAAAALLKALIQDA